MENLQLFSRFGCGYNTKYLGIISVISPSSFVVDTTRNSEVNEYRRFDIKECSKL